jgi:hypothetical protein
VLGTLLSRDPFMLKRPHGGVDDEGSPRADLTTVGSYRGTWGSPSSRDLDIAARAGQVVDAVCAGAFPARLGDHLEGLRGSDWVVMMIRPLVTHQRVFLRRLD